MPKRVSLLSSYSESSTSLPLRRHRYRCSSSKTVYTFDQPQFILLSPYEPAPPPYPWPSAHFPSKGVAKKKLVRFVLGAEISCVCNKLVPLIEEEGPLRCSYLSIVVTHESHTEYMKVSFRRFVSLRIIIADTMILCG